MRQPLIPHRSSLAQPSSVKLLAAGSVAYNWQGGLLGGLGSDAILRYVALVQTETTLSRQEQTELARLGFSLGPQLGSGAMSTVYALSGLHLAPGQSAPFPGHAELAIKVLHAMHTGNIDLVLRFLQEEAVAAKVRHPAILRIFGSGMIGVRPYLLMERLTNTLHHQLPFLDRMARIYIAIRVAQGAAVLHESGVIHRDLKPSNVMVGGGAAPVVKIVDFSLAKWQSVPAGLRISTAQSDVLGTAEYRAPEAWISAKEADEKSDVYSLGVMLFELWNDRLPFLGVRQCELMDQHLYETAPLLPSSPQPLTDLVAAMLDKRRSRRPRMHEVAQRLLKIVKPR